MREVVGRRFSTQFVLGETNRVALVKVLLHDSVVLDLEDRIFFGSAHQWPDTLCEQSVIVKLWLILLLAYLRPDGSQQTSRCFRALFRRCRCRRIAPTQNPMQRLGRSTSLRDECALLYPVVRPNNTSDNPSVAYSLLAQIFGEKEFPSLFEAE